ncbi:autoinducer binding domain-containing protein [Yoonia vestfoldensis]|uniref:autoinducer binding domain-containing protein n=1 Tax=Yoonia vestfoldensis TaxID=245188 RepID=UPI0004754D48|nr:autoinducer binding domain-containing protein [Yoonia vestfoldensis]
MPATQLQITSILERFNGLAPDGYAIGLNIQYTTPRFMFQTYPKAWLDHYSRNGLLMSDPMVAWGFEHAGTARWSELSDPAGVMQKAAEFGLSYGVVITEVSEDDRSICGFARKSAEFTDAEIADLAKCVSALHAITADMSRLDPTTVDQLKKMSIMVTHPGS